MHITRNTFLWLAIGWAAIIFVLSAMPGRFFPTISMWEIFSADKIVHMIMYGILTWLAWRATATTTLQKLWLWAALSTAYGASMEWMQETFFTDRMFEYLDMLANAIGAAVAALGVSVAAILKRR